MQYNSMKTLILNTEDVVMYEFSHNDTTCVVNFHRPTPIEVLEGEEQPEEQPFDHDAMSEIEYQRWLNWIGASE